MRQALYEWIADAPVEASLIIVLFLLIFVMIFAAVAAPKTPQPLPPPIYVVIITATPDSQR